MVFNYDSLIIQVPDERSTINFLQERGLLHSHRMCECGQKMNIRNVSRHGNIAQNWRCPKRRCRKNKGLRIDTWFHPSKLEFNTILKFIFWWARELTSIKFCRRELGMSKNAVIDYSMYMREVCANTILQHQQQVIIFCMHYEPGYRPLKKVTYCAL